MRLRYLALPAFMLVAIFLTSFVSGAPAEKTVSYKLPASCTVQKLRPFAAKVWDPHKWRRGKPNKNSPVLKAYAKRLGCAPPAHKRAMKRTWHRDQKIFFKHRKNMLWFAKYRHYEYPDGSHWAVPYPIALCESTENYYAGPSGAYGEIPPLPQWQPPKVQDEIAYRLFQEQGEEPWAPYEQECEYR